MSRHEHEDLETAYGDCLDALMSAPGYMGCWSCGKLTACADMKRVTVIYHGRELSTPGYECEACDNAERFAALAIKVDDEIRQYMGLA